MKEGDKVKIVNYGSPLMVQKDSTLNFPVIIEKDNYKVLDKNPELVGAIGVIRIARTDGQYNRYALTLDEEGGVAWFTEEQLQPL